MSGHFALPFITPFSFPSLRERPIGRRGHGHQSPFHQGAKTPAELPSRLQDREHHEQVPDWIPTRRPPFSNTVIPHVSIPYVLYCHIHMFLYCHIHMSPYSMFLYCHIPMPPYSMSCILILHVSVLSCPVSPYRHTLMSPYCRVSNSETHQLRFLLAPRPS